jgi:hypothetical protein
MTRSNGQIYILQPVLRSIYGENAIRLWYPSSSNGNYTDSDGPSPNTVRFEVVVS